MRILSLTQPWASLIAVGAKRIETRSWSRRYRGPLAIHAAKGLGPGGQQGFFKQCFAPHFREALTPAMTVPQRIGRIAQGGADLDPRRLPFGAIVAVCTLTDVFETLGDGYIREPGGRNEIHITEEQQAFGDFSPGRFAWWLADVQALREPLPYRGAQGLRILDAHTVNAVMAWVQQ